MLNNRNIVGKIKKLSSVMAALLFCILTLTVGASAEAVNKIELKARGSEAQITIDFPQAAAEEIASLQLSLSLDVSSDKAEIEFIPDSGLTAKIIESRYHSDTGILNIYLAGTEAIFSSSPLSIGIVKISGSASSATVNIVKDSVKFVRGGELIEGENLTEVYGDITYPDHVIITTKNTPSRPVTGGSSHTHSYGDWTVTVNATCSKEGERIRTCRICGRTDIETIPQLEHDYISLGSHEADGTTSSYTDYMCVHCAQTKREFDAILGDVDKNGRVNSLDAAIILKAIVNKTDLEPSVADFNKDGTVNALDAAAILKWIVSQ